MLDKLTTNLSKNRLRSLMSSTFSKNWIKVACSIRIDSGVSASNPRDGGHMSISKSVSQQIELLQPGKLFSYQDISGYAEHSDAVIKAISRNSERLGLVKIKKGLFYKSELGRFGPMAPKESDIIKYFIFQNNKTIGYITGPTLYHRWGLTTQIPAEVSIATSKNKREKAELSGLRISTFPAKYNKVSKNNIKILQFLDIISNIDRIPDANTGEVTIKLSKKLSNYSRDNIREMERIAVNAYPERSKAILGFLLDHYLNYVSSTLEKSLNKTSYFYVPLSYGLNSAFKRWKLKNKE